MPSDVKTLLKKHQKLVQTDGVKVVSHVQKDKDEWFENTVMIEGVDVPFKYKRQKLYRNLAGTRVNLTYYPEEITVAGIPFEVMKVVRIKVS
jgi:hypothetical protein